MPCSSRRSGLMLAAMLVVPGLLIGCKAKPGDKCTGSSASCLGPNEALVCLDGTQTPVSCGGPAGCSAAGGEVECDNSFASVGDGCITNGDIACAIDKKAALECDQNKFRVIETCRASRGCEVKDNKISCDNNVAEIDDPCHRNGDYACTVDKKFVAKCVNNKFDPYTSCRGPKACRVYELPEESRVEFSCDDTLAQENDPCDTSGEYACSVDQKALYTCKDGKYAPLKPCPGGCSYDEQDHSLSCMQSGGEKTVMAKAMKTGKAGSAPVGKPTGTAAKPTTSAPAASAVATAPKPGTSASPPAAGSIVAAASASPTTAASGAASATHHAAAMAPSASAPATLVAAAPKPVAGATSAAGGGKGAKTPALAPTGSAKKK